MKLSQRCCNNIVSIIAHSLDVQAEQHQKLTIENIEKKRQIHRSRTSVSHRQNLKSPFTSNTKQGSLFTKIPPQIPYIFIPNEKKKTFIMPERVFQKGEAGKRCKIVENLVFIQMKDSSVVSFRGEERERFRKILNRRGKTRIIQGRKMEELNRITNQNDGCEKRKKNKINFKNRKIFQPSSSTKGCFYTSPPMFSSSSTVNLRKINSADRRSHIWKGISKTTGLFSKESKISSIR